MQRRFLQFFFDPSTIGIAADQHGSSSPRQASKPINNYLISLSDDWQWMTNAYFLQISYGHNISQIDLAIMASTNLQNPNLPGSVPFLNVHNFTQPTSYIFQVSTTAEGRHRHLLHCFHPFPLHDCPPKCQWKHPHPATRLYCFSPHHQHKHH